MSNKTITTTIIIATRNKRKCNIHKPFKVVVLSFITNIIIKQDLILFNQYFYFLVLFLQEDEQKYESVSHF